MVLNKKYIYSFLAGLIIGSVATYYIFKKDVKEVKVPVEIEVKVPEIVVEKDTVFYPKPVYVPGKKEIDSSLYKEYTKLKDSIEKEKLFKEAIELNVYNEIIEDDTLRIDLNLKTRGKLLSYQVGYKIFERNFSIDTTLTVAVPKQAKIYGGAKLSLPGRESVTKESIYPSLLFIPKNDKNAYNLSYDFINRNLEIGYYFRF